MSFQNKTILNSVTNIYRKVYIFATEKLIYPFDISVSDIC